MEDTENSQTTQTRLPVATNPINDHSSPFYLHPSDSPGMLLVNTLFDGKGYAGWSRAFVIALSAKNKLGMIDGTSEVPNTSSANYKAWTRCNDMVISWILNSLSKDIVESVLYLKTTQKIWKELATRFGQCNGAQLYQLQKELSDAVQGNSDIASYFTKVKKIWDELYALITFDQCSCKCICNGKVTTIKAHHVTPLIR
ncbi:uncharacterized protein LOC132057623 [Lycium ferocissimum]|uniref:uncharacterized protein LOC132057623 n=1 Tax=Lycium ferocissimum TaxID=112874 RepID=UPI00281580AD|nr:uncharacterized protein LOC132057623 [Lycium ferocissimum]